MLLLHVNNYYIFSIFDSLLNIIERLKDNVNNNKSS